MFQIISNWLISSSYFVTHGFCFRNIQPSPTPSNIIIINNIILFSWLPHHCRIRKIGVSFLLSRYNFSVDGCLGSAVLWRGWNQYWRTSIFWKREINIQHASIARYSGFVRCGPTLAHSNHRPNLQKKYVNMFFVSIAITPLVRSIFFQIIKGSLNKYVPHCGPHFIHSVKRIAIERTLMAVGLKHRLFILF